MKNDTRTLPSEKILQSLLENAGPVAEITSATTRPERTSVRVSSLDSLQRDMSGLKLQDASGANPGANPKPGDDAGKASGGKVIAFGDRKPTDN